MRWWQRRWRRSQTIKAKPRRRGWGMFLFGFMLGAAALFGVALYASLRNL